MRTAYVNGRYVPLAEASVHVEDRGFQFADGGPEGFRGRGRPRREQLVGQRNRGCPGQIGMGVDKTWW